MIAYKRFLSKLHTLSSPSGAFVLGCERWARTEVRLGPARGGQVHLRGRAVLQHQALHQRAHVALAEEHRERPGQGERLRERDLLRGYSVGSRRVYNFPASVLLHLCANSFASAISVAAPRDRRKMRVDFPSRVLLSYFRSSSFHHR